MSKKDFVYFLTIPDDDKLAIAFCNSENDTPHSAKQKINQVLMKKGLESYQLSYLGLLDYREMDRSISNHLHFFEKYGEVWLLL